MLGAITTDILAVQQCPDGYEANCTLTGYRMADGEPAWDLDRKYIREDLAFPAPLRANLQTGQLDLPNFASSPGVVPQRSFAVLSESTIDDRTQVHVTAADLATGELGQWTDRIEAYSPNRYIPMGPNLIVAESTGLSIVDSMTGRRTHPVPLLGSYATGADSFMTQPVVLAGDDLLLDVSARNDDLTFDGVEEWRTVNLATGRASREHRVDELLVGVGHGIAITLSDTEDNPNLRGVDLGTGKKAWQFRFYDDPDNISGFHSSALFMAAGRLSISSRPGVRNPEKYLDGWQTRLVELSTGDVTLIEGVTALGLGENGMLVFVHPAEGEDHGRARLVYY